MPVTVMPLGVLCNLQCGYCYEDPQRDAANLGGRYDLEAIKESLAEASGGPFLLFGGEPLLMPKEDLEDLWAWGLERHGRNTLQTNGTLIDEDHLALFKRFNVRVSISIDGPGPLNDSRWHRTLEETRAATRRTEEAIARLCADGTPPGLIVTLHRLNATGGALDRLLEWFKELEAMGIRSAGIHLLEVENELARRKYALSDEENVNAVMRLRETQKELTTLQFSLLRDLEALLLGDDSRAKCIWTACDPYATKAVEGIGGHGELIGCGRTVKDGVPFLTSHDTGYERYRALYRTPQDGGGCEGCRFFLMCRGQCPGTSINGDWRNKSEQCGTWKGVFAALEAELVSEGKEPLSLSPLREAVELELLESWQQGRRASVGAMVRVVNEGAEERYPVPEDTVRVTPPRVAAHR
jgi:uncharacterized protein